MSFNVIFHNSMNSIFLMKICDTFLIYGPNIDCWCLLEPPQWGRSNKHSQSMLWATIRNKRAMMALYRSPEVLWTVQKCSRESVNKILLRFDLVTYFWTQSHPLSRQTFWYSFIKIEAKLWPLEGEQDFNSIWPSDPVFFYPTWPIFELDQDIIKTNTLIKFHENWNKSMASRRWT